MDKLLDWLRHTFAPRLGVCRGCDCPVAADAYECAECTDARQT
jgi:hypothetical protein